MENYHPSKAPPPEEWLKLAEELRIDWVRQSHEAAGIQLKEGTDTVHFILHVIVENQLAMNVEPVPATVSRLTRQGLNRHEAIHAIGAVISGDLFDTLKSGQEYNLKKYRHRLNKLTAKRWLKGKW